MNVRLFIVATSAFFLSVSACGERPVEEPQQVLQTDIETIPAEGSVLATRQVLYEHLLSFMCAAPFVEDLDFTDYYSQDGPGRIRYQCEHTVNPVCSTNYQPVGGIQASGGNMSYSCQKQGGGPAPSNPACAGGFSAANASGNSYACDAQVTRTCFQSHWHATSLESNVNHVTYICWGTSL